MNILQDKLNQVRELFPFKSFDSFKSLKESDELVSNFILVLYETVYFPMGIDKECYLIFIEKLKNLYLDNFYHNFYHAIDVTRTLCELLLSLENDIKNTITNIDLIALVTAILCHDVGHFGKTGKYVELCCLPPKKETTSEEFCRVYEKYVFTIDSTLEQFHYYLASEIIDKSGLFSNLPRENIKQIDREMKQIILATDPITLKACLDDNDFSSSKSQIFKLLTKCADIGSTLKPFEIHKNWSFGLQEEFWIQGDEMKKNNMELIPIFDRSIKNISKGQSDFFSFYAMPLYIKLGQILDKKSMIHLYNDLYINRDNWKLLENE